MLTNKFTLNVFKILSGNGLYQLILVISLPFITAIYGVENYGKFSVLFGLSVVLGVASTFRYEQAIVPAKNDIELRNITTLCLSFVAIVTILTGILALSGYPFFRTSYSLISIILTALCVGLNGVILVQNQILNYRNKFTLISRGKVASAAAMIISQFVLSKYSVSTNSLLEGYTLGLTLQLLVLSRGCKSILNQVLSIETLHKTAKQFKAYPQTNYPSALLNVMSYQGPTIGVGIVFGPIIAGQYAIMQKCLNAPSALLGSAISQPYYNICAELVRNKERLLPFFKKVNGYLSLLGLIGLPISILIFPTLIDWAFGTEFEIAGYMGQIMLIYYTLRFIANSQNTILLALKKLKSDLYLTISLSLSQLLPLVFGYLIKPDSWIPIFVAMAILGTASYIFHIYTYMKATNEYESMLNQHFKVEQEF